MTDLTPGSPEWARRVSPSKAAAILGISPWDSQYAIWRKMRGDVPWDEESEAMERGNLLEAGVLNWWRKRHPDGDWAEQVTHTIGDWCVATPDAVAGRTMVEAKTSSDDSQWGTPGTDEIPDYYLTQVYLAMHVLNLAGTPVDECHVPLLGPRLRFVNYVVPYHAEYGALLLAKCKAFHDTLGADVPPPLDDTVATYDAVRKVHKDIDRGESVELTEGQARELVEFQAESKAIEPALRYCKSVVLERMGRAQYATWNGVRIARRQGDGPDRTKFVVVAKPHDLPDTSDTTTRETAA